MVVDLYFFEFAVLRACAEVEFASLQASRHQPDPQDQSQDYAAFLQVEPTGKVLHERQIGQGTCSRRNPRV